jgi:hypothetical protein
MIKSWKQFNERNIPIADQTVGGASGGTTAPVGPMGPNYGSIKLRNSTISQDDTDVIYSEITSNLYTYNDYQQLYQDYLKNGGKPLHGFTQENLETVLLNLSSN